MNKFLLASVLLFPVITFAANDTDISQFALDPRGNCKEFSIADTIPDTWKIVNSCKNYRSTEVGLRPEDVLNRRWTALRKRLSAKKSGQESEAKNPPILTRNRIGSGTLTRGGTDREMSNGEVKQPLRTSTKMQYGTTKQFLLNDSRRLKKSRTEWVRRRNARLGTKSGSATKMDRSGQLSDKFWSTETAIRNKRLDDQESTKGWEKYLSNRQYLSKKGRKKQKKYVYKGISLRRIYRGAPLKGTLESEIK